MGLRMATRGFDLRDGLLRCFEMEVGREDRMSLACEAKAESAAHAAAGAGDENGAWGIFHGAEEYRARNSRRMTLFDAVRGSASTRTSSWILNSGFRSRLIAPCIAAASCFLSKFCALAQ